MSKSLLLESQGNPQRILRLPEVLAATGLRHTAIYERIAAGTFPRPVPLGIRAVGWLAEEVEEWRRDLIEAREQKRVRAPERLAKPRFVRGGGRPTLGLRVKEAERHGSKKPLRP